MTAIPAVSSIKFNRIFPIVPVSDIQRALSFYVDVLGFEKVFENGDPVGFVILQKDEVQLDLSLNRKHKATTDNVAFLNVSDATALYELCVRNGVRIVKGLRDAEYGLRTFVFSDPDGNRIDVGQSISR